MVRIPSLGFTTCTINFYEPEGDFESAGSATRNAGPFGGLIWAKSPVFCVCLFACLLAVPY